MLLQEMFERVIVNSGQFMLTMDSLELKKDNFALLVKQAIGTYNHYDPIDKHLFVQINNKRQYTFTEENTPEGVPEMIAEITPCRIMGVYPFFMREFMGQNPNLEIKTEMPWEYRKPILTVSIQGEYDVHAVWKHVLVKNADGQWECSTIDDSYEEFFKLLTGKFMQALGMSRDAFTMGNLPITTNASQLMSEGKEMEATALESIRTNKMKFYLAWKC